MGRLFIIFFLFFINQALWASNYQLARTDSRNDSGDFSLVQTLVNSETLSNPQEFLDTWKALRPDFFSNYVLAYRSRSLQESSFLHPRALIFNENADLIMTYNGHHEQEGYNAIELMRFNHENNAFEFYEMTFTNNLAQLSQPNPTKCLACHQGSNRQNTDPRPNWEPYNMWPGFYGSIDDDTDFRRTLTNVRNELIESGDELLLEEADQEATRFYEFMSSEKKSNPRYTLLSDQTIDQYENEDTLNGDLTNLLAILNFQRVARIIRTENTELYEKVKWTVLGHAKCGQEVYMSKDSIKWLYEKVPGLAKQRFEKSVDAADNPRTYYGESPDGLGRSSFTPPVPEFYRLRTTHLINILFEAFGVSTEDWSMDFKTNGGRFSAFERFGVPNEPGPPWVFAVKYEFSKDPEFSNLNELSCDEIKSKSLEAFRDLESTQSLWNAFTSLRVEIPHAPLINRCIGCHVDENYGLIPFIPFDNPQQLAIELNNTGYRRGSLLEEIEFRLGPHATNREQMPRGPVPSSESRRELLDYLENLSQ